MSENNSDRQEGIAQFNQQTPLECPACEYDWGYTGDMRTATCPSCLGKVNVRENVRVAADGGSTTFTMEGYTPTDLPGNFDVDATFNTKEKNGQVVVYLALDQEECEELWDHITGETGHEYPDDVREQVLDALGFPL